MGKERPGAVEKRGLLPLDVESCKSLDGSAENINSLTALHITHEKSTFD